MSLAAYRMCVNPISLVYSSFACSGRMGMVLVTRNIDAMMSLDEYPRSLVAGWLVTRPRNCMLTYHKSRRESSALSSLPSEQLRIMA